jgi:hypothetical protein
MATTTVQKPPGEGLAAYLRGLESDAGLNAMLKQAKSVGAVQFADAFMGATQNSVDVYELATVIEKPGAPEEDFLLAFTLDAQDRTHLRIFDRKKLLDETQRWKWDLRPLTADQFASESGLTLGTVRGFIEKDVANKQRMVGVMQFLNDIRGDPRVYQNLYEIWASNRLESRHLTTTADRVQHVEFSSVVYVPEVHGKTTHYFELGLDPQPGGTNTVTCMEHADGPVYVIPPSVFAQKTSWDAASLRRFVTTDLQNKLRQIHQ